jgi:hypothetical protein
VLQLGLGILGFCLRLDDFTVTIGVGLFLFRDFGFKKWM